MRCKSSRPVLGGVTDHAIFGSIMKGDDVADDFAAGRKAPELRTRSLAERRGNDLRNWLAFAGNQDRLARSFYPVEQG